MRTKTKKFGILILILFAVVTFSGFGCKEKSVSYDMTLEVWGIFDDSDAFTEILNAYRDVNPNVKDIRYRKFTPESYKKDLLDALASGEGPDVFMIHNTWLPSFQDKIVAAPDTLVGEQEFRANFVDVAANDFLRESAVYAVPLSVDALALYYNRDLLNAAGIVTPPTTWEEFNDAVKKLTRVDQFGNITQSGAAIGTAYNVNRSTDLLSALMLQGGAVMTDRDRIRATFTDPVRVGSNTQTPGITALTFYTQFARSTSALYTWNKRQHYSLDAFYEGTTAMMVNYSWHYDTIRRKNEKLNFSVAPLPQIVQNQPVNYANYWGLAVAKNKTLPKFDSSTAQRNAIPVTNEMRLFESWQFLRFLSLKHDGDQMTITSAATGAQKASALPFDPAENYLQKTKKPAARRDLLEKQKKDPVIGPFAAGNLIAKSWYQVDPEAAEAILAEAIDAVNNGAAEAQEALSVAQNRISQLMRK